MSTADRNPLRFRSAELVAAILGAVYSADEAGEDPYRWTELVAEFTDDHHTEKTVDNVIRELAAFGALHRLGRPGKGLTDSRLVVATPLGRAWLDQVVLPLHRAEETDP